MPKTKTADLHPGMILGDDVVLSDGRLLIRSGTLLDFEHLRAVRLWGIQELEIRETSRSGDEGPSEPAEATPAAAGDPTLLEKRFSKCDPEHRVIREIYRVVQANPGVPGFSVPERRYSSSQEAWLQGDPQPERLGADPPAAASDDPQALVDPDLELVSLPDIFYQVLGVINNPRSSAFQIAEVISKDPSLSAKLLKIVNSAFYGFPKQVDTISRAVAIVGGDQLSTLTLGTSVFSLFQDIPPDLMNMRWFWEHSLAVGITARVIASSTNLPNIEQLFISGLLHDLGKLIIFKNRPHQASAILNRAFHYDLFHFEAEQDRLGYDHSQVGTVLARRWKLPLSLEQAISRHHDPLQFPPSSEAAVIFMADNLVNALGYGTSGEQFVSPATVPVWEYLRLPGGILENLITLINRQLEETFHLFFP